MLHIEHVDSGAPTRSPNLSFISFAFACSLLFIVLSRASIDALLSSGFSLGRKIANRGRRVNRRWRMTDHDRDVTRNQ